MPNKIKLYEAINQSLHKAMNDNADVICFGLGTDDPKGIFGTTLGLKESFGGERVFDMPTAENGMTGVAIGAALGGKYPVMSHQRLDFFLLCMDQLVNNAAKWRYMFGGQNSVPLTIRLIIGRGWGQGPTHSQNLQSWFAHIPGLKVVCPTSPQKAFDQLYDSIFDPNPVLFLEHRWLHAMEGEVNAESTRAEFGKAEVVHSGDELTIVCYSYMVPEAIRAAKFLKSTYGVGVDVIDLCSLHPIDWESIHTSIKKTGRLLALDTSHEQCSISSEIVANVSENFWSRLKSNPKRLALPNHPTPTSNALTKEFYLDAKDVVKESLRILGLDVSIQSEILNKPGPHDVPGAWFSGPF